MINFKYYFRLAKGYIRVNLKQAAEFKFDFVAYFIGELIYIALSFLFAIVFTKAIPNMGLTYMQLFIYSQTIDTLMTFIWASQAQIVNLVRQGTLNMLLIRPINILFQIYFGSLNTKMIFITIIKLITIAIVSAIYLNTNAIIYLIVIFIITLISTVFMQSIYYLLRSRDIKHLESGGLLYSITNINQFNGKISTFPIYLFPKLFLIYLAFFPIYYIANITLNIVKFGNTFEIFVLISAELILAIIFLVAANYAWKKMLKYYEGFGG